MTNSHRDRIKAAYDDVDCPHLDIPCGDCLADKVLAALYPFIAAQALLRVEQRLGAAEYISRGGLPFVGRESMFRAVNDACRDLLGDEWRAIMRAEVERSRRNA